MVLKVEEEIEGVKEDFIEAYNLARGNYSGSEVLVSGYERFRDKGTD